MVCMTSSAVEFNFPSIRAQLVDTTLNNHGFHTTLKTRNYGSPNSKMGASSQHFDPEKACDHLLWGI